MPLPSIVPTKDPPPLGATTTPPYEGEVPASPDPGQSSTWVTTRPPVPSTTETPGVPSSTETVGPLPDDASGAFVYLVRELSDSFPPLGSDDADGYIVDEDLYDYVLLYRDADELVDCRLEVRYLVETSDRRHSVWHCASVTICLDWTTGEPAEDAS